MKRASGSVESKLTFIRRLSEASYKVKVQVVGLQVC